MIVLDFASSFKSSVSLPFKASLRSAMPCSIVFFLQMKFYLHVLLPFFSRVTMLSAWFLASTASLFYLPLYSLQHLLPSYLFLHLTISRSLNLYFLFLTSTFIFSRYSYYPISIYIKCNFDLRRTSGAGEYRLTQNFLVSYYQLPFLFLLCKTFIATAGWLSSAVEKIGFFL